MTLDIPSHLALGAALWLCSGFLCIGFASVQQDTHRDAMRSIVVWHYRHFFLSSIGILGLILAFIISVSYQQSADPVVLSLIFYPLMGLLVGFRFGVIATFLAGFVLLCVSLGLMFV
jgi:hypothetical protein